MKELHHLVSVKRVWGHHGYSMLVSWLNKVHDICNAFEKCQSKSKVAKSMQPHPTCVVVKCFVHFNKRLSLRLRAYFNHNSGAYYLPDNQTEDRFDLFFTFSDVLCGMIYIVYIFVHNIMYSRSSNALKMI